MTRNAVPPIQRFWDKVKTDFLNPEGCWVWTGKTNEAGYGVIRANPNGQYLLAHRVSYEDAKGPIPEGLELDHLCENKPCVRPDHLEAVPHEVNLARAYKTWCKKRLHRMDNPTNVYIDPQGKRRCRSCRALRA